MTATYLIVYGADPADRFAAYAYPSRKAALAASLTLVPGVPEGANAGGCAYVIGKEEDITFSGRHLVDVFNALTESGVKKFETRAHGTRRLMAVLPESAKSIQSTEDEETMTTRTPLGDFKQVREGSNFGKIAAHIIDNPGATVETTAAALGVNAPVVQAALVGARRSHGVDHAIDPETKAVTIVIPEGGTLFKATAAPKPERAPRAAKPLGQFSPIREGSTLGAIVKRVLEGGATTASVEGVEPDKVVAQLKRARVTHGIDHAIAEDGTLSLVVPEGTELFTVVKAPRIPSGKPRQSKHTALDAVAATGVMPDRLVITSKANAHRQKYADRLHDLADGGKWDEVATFNMKGTDTYCKLINRHRDRLLAAHAAQ